MSRLMSVLFTEDAVRARVKTVTRRKGWLFAKPGDRITLCRKVMGRRAGEPLERITDVEVVNVRREPLQALLDDVDYGIAEVVLEGGAMLAPELRFPSHFVDHFFLRAQGMSVHDDVTRIEWRYLDPTPERTTP